MKKKSKHLRQNTLMEKSFWNWSQFSQEVVHSMELLKWLLEQMELKILQKFTQSQNADSEEMIMSLKERISDVLKSQELSMKVSEMRLEIILAFNAKTPLYIIKLRLPLCRCLWQENLTMFTTHCRIDITRQQKLLAFTHPMGPEMVTQLFKSGVRIS